MHWVLPHIIKLSCNLYKKNFRLIIVCCISFPLKSLLGISQCICHPLTAEPRRLGLLDPLVFFFSIMQHH